MTLHTTRLTAWDAPSIGRKLISVAIIPNAPGCFSTWNGKVHRWNRRAA